MNPLLKIENLSVSYHTYMGEVQSVRGISFEVQEGKTVALVGESGCGKSVTAKSILGLIQKPGKISAESSVLFKSADMMKNSEKEWNRFRGKECSMIFQDALVSLNPTMKIGKQIIENLKNHQPDLSRHTLIEKAKEMLELVGIADAGLCLEKYPHELSGGMRQRVMIATAMITHPCLLIADEPTTALDVTIQAQIIELMKELQKKMNMAIILITHDLGVVADIADEVIVMYAGKIVEKGSCMEIFCNPQHPYTWALLNSVPRVDLEGKQELETIEGSIPDMIHPPKGCAFCSRCRYAMHICSIKQPEKQELSEGHEVSCWLQDERADRTDVPFGKGGICDAG